TITVCPSQSLRCGEWLLVSRGPLLRLDLHHLVQPAGNENSRVLLEAGIFSIAFLALNRRQTTYRFVVPTSRGVGSAAAASRIWVGSLRWTGNMASMSDL